MTKVEDVLYLLSVNGEAVRALDNDRDTEVEAVLKSHSTLKTTVDFDPGIETEMQIVWRGERYLISNIEVTRENNKPIMKIEAEIAYMSLSSRIIKKNVAKSPMSAIVDFLLEDTRWSVGNINDNLAGEHRLLLDEEDYSVLAILRQLEDMSDGDVMLTFDTIKYKVNFVDANLLDSGVLFTYGRNAESVDKSVNAPLVTRVVPEGRDGLTIGPVNNGVDYVEDYSYYMDRGYSLEDARRDFTKIEMFQDDRFTNHDSLKKEAVKRLNELSQPQIAYSTNIAMVDRPVKVGMRGYVQDEETDTRIKAEIVRVVERKDYRDSEVEFNHLKPSLSDRLGSSGSGSSRGLNIVYGRLDRDFISSESDYEVVLEVRFIQRQTGHISAGFNLQAEASNDVILDGYFTLDDDVTGHKVKQSMSAFNSEGYPFVLPDVEPGPYTLKLHVMSESGTFNVNSGEGEIYVMADTITEDNNTVIPEEPVEPAFEVPTFDDITIYGNIHYDKILPAIGNSDGLIIDDIRSRDFDNYRIDSRGIDLDSAYSDTGGLAVRLFGTHEETDGIDYEVIVTFRNDNDERESTTFIITVLFDDRTGLKPPEFQRLLGYKGIYYPEIIIKRLPYSEAWDEWQIVSIDTDAILEHSQLLRVEPARNGNIRVSGIVQESTPSFAVRMAVHMTHPTAGDDITTVEMTFNPKPHDLGPGDPNYELKG